MDFIFNSSNGKLTLNSGLNENMFSKAKFTRFLTDKGFIAEKDENGIFKNFESYFFSGTKSEKEYVHFTAMNFDGENVLKIIESAGSEKIKEVIFAICQAYIHAELQNIKLPCIGAGGILYGDEKLIFAPEILFERCALNFEKAYCSRIHSYWINSAAEGKAAFDFIIAVYTYYAFTKKMPYSKNISDEQSINIFYKNFIPLEYCVNGIDKNLSNAVNTILSGKTYKKQFPLDKLEKEFFSEKKRHAELTENEFQKRKENFFFKQQKKIKNKQILLKHYAAAITCFAASIIVLIFILCIRNEYGKKPSVIGLNSIETVKIFYTGIHRMNTDLILASAETCPEAQIYITGIPRIYAAAQMRSAFNFEAGISTPEQWLFFEPASKRAYFHEIYGITNFCIDGIPSTLNLDIPTKKNHPHKLMHIAGKKLNSKSSAVHNINYWLIHNTGNLIKTDFYKTKVFLNWKKDKWQIVKLEQNISSHTINLIDFSQELKEIFEENGSIIDSANILREKHSWLPSEQSLKEEKINFEQKGY